LFIRPVALRVIAGLPKLPPAGKIRQGKFCGGIPLTPESNETAGAFFDIPAAKTMN